MENKVILRKKIIIVSYNIENAVTIKNFVEIYFNWLGTIA